MYFLGQEPSAQERRENWLATSSQFQVENADDIPTVTVSASFDWKFWLAVAALIALFVYDDTRSGNRSYTRRLRRRLNRR